MARVAKKVTAKATTNADKLTVVETLGYAIFDEIKFKENSNGKKYIATSHGAVYAQLDQIKPFVVYLVQKMNNDMLVLNTPTNPVERVKAIKAMSEEAGVTISEFKELMGL